MTEIDRLVHSWRRLHRMINGRVVPLPLRTLYVSKTPGTLEYEATQIIHSIWPKDETGALIPMEHLTPDQWKHLAEGEVGAMRERFNGCSVSYRNPPDRLAYRQDGG